MTSLHVVPQHAVGRPAIDRGPKHHRRDKRISNPPIRVAIDGEVYPTVDWSFGGVLVRCDRMKLRVGDQVRVTGLGPAEGRLLQVDVATRAVRVEDGFVAVEFLELSTRAYAVLEALMMRRGRILMEAAAA